jgi:hypothetical protein
VFDRVVIDGQVGQSVENVSLSDDGVDEVGIAVELVLNDVVEDFEQEED